ncbi:hypothetical protein [Flavobacterium sp. W21_SRS_FM6]|uniref:hypothetical protein n=1 Tax=Flavobacterium sp. W21_SRS_FM6 TaxID=3240268 RepID=UPI003F927AF3
MEGNKVYSPTQAALGALLGGPIASAYFIKQNFFALKDDESIKKTNLFGSLAIAFVLAILPFLPENFPNMVIPIITIVSTRLLIETFQFKKEDISNSEDLDFQSNWKVFFVGLISLIIFMVIAVSLILTLDALGIASVA